MIRRRNPLHHFIASLNAKENRMHHPNMGSQLELGDLVRMGEGPFMDAIVKQVETNENGFRYITLVRPYMIPDDFSHTGGVTVYTGHETYQIGMHTPCTVLRKATGIK